MTMVSFTAGVRNLFVSVEVTRDDGPVTESDTVSAMCEMFKALKSDAQEGFGDTGTGAEYRFAKADGPVIRDNLMRRIENHNLTVERDNALTQLDTLNEVIGEVRGVCKAGQTEETTLAVRRALQEAKAEAVAGTLDSLLRRK